MNEIIKLYKEAVKNVRFLKYSYVLIAAIAILALIAYFKLNNNDVFIYAFVILFISFLTIVLSKLASSKDKIIKVGLYIVIYSLIVTICTGILSFASFIIWETPTFYKRWFSDLNEKPKNAVQDKNKSLDSNIAESKELHLNTKNIGTISKTTPGYPAEGMAIEKNKITDTAKNKTHKIKIAVLPFEHISDDNSFHWLSKGIAESLLAEMGQLMHYDIVEGIQRDKVLKEIDFQQGKYVDIETAVKVGKMLGANQIIIGSYQIFDKKIKITSRNVNVETSHIDSRSLVQYEGSTDSLFFVEKEYSFKMVKSLH